MEWDNVYFTAWCPRRRSHARHCTLTRTRTKLFLTTKDIKTESSSIVCDVLPLSNGILPSYIAIVREGHKRVSYNDSFFWLTLGLNGPHTARARAWAWHGGKIISCWLSGIIETTVRLAKEIWARYKLSICCSNEREKCWPRRWWRLRCCDAASMIAECPRENLHNLIFLKINVLGHGRAILTQLILIACG